MRGIQAFETSDRKKARGQALVELALFGSFFILILGAMISYALKYNFNQQAQMRAFRTAMRAASDVQQGRGTSMILEDKHIPDPTDEFGIGSVVPVSASAMVTRDIYMDAQVDDKDSLPSVIFDRRALSVNGQEGPTYRRMYRTAGLRYEDPIRNLQQQYTNPTTSSNYGRRERDSNYSSTWNAAMRAVDDNTLAKYRLVYGSVAEIKDEYGYVQGLRITDSCRGDVINYGSCYTQAAIMVDEGLCQESCEDSMPEDADCAKICSATVNPPNQYNPSYQGGAWYAADYVRHAPDGLHHNKTWYEFPYLDALFEEAGLDPKNGDTMGLQNDATISTTKSTQMLRTEGPEAIQTVERARQVTDINRVFIQNNNLDAEGYEVDHQQASQYLGRIEIIPMPSQVATDLEETWTTDK